MPAKKRKRSPSLFWKRYPELASQRPTNALNPLSVDVSESEGRFRVVITLGQGVTGKDIRKAIPFALAVNDRLVDWQGVELSRHAKYLLALHDEGWSYAQIAAVVNELQGEYAMAYAKYLARDFVYKNHEHLKKFIFSTKDLEVSSKSAQPFYDLLSAMRVGSQDTQTFLINARIATYNGWNGIRGDDPFTRDDVITAIRYWRGKTKQKPMAKTGPKSTTGKRKRQAYDVLNQKTRS
jgi:hypothetical protein